MPRTTGYLVTPVLKLILFAALAVTLCLSGCGTSQVAPSAYVKPQSAPPLGAGTLLALPTGRLPTAVTAPITGALAYEVTLPRGDHNSKLWIYRPSPISSAKVPLVLISFFGVFFAAGALCACFWSPLADEPTCLNWGAWVVLMVLMPLLLIHPLALLLLIALYPLAVVPFHIGAEWGAQWWKQRRWRHFLGLANDYERDD